jgi:membrane-associated phospholipid phosphatase
MDNLWVNIFTSAFVLGMLISYQPYWDKALFNYSLKEIPVI